MAEYFKVDTVIELICFLLALTGLLKKSSLIWKAFIIYLFMVCVTEFTGLYLKFHDKPNQWPYNALLLFQFVTLSLMFAHLFNKYIKSKPLILGGLALLALLYMYELFDHGFLLYNNTTYTVMSILFVLYSLYFYYLLLKDEQYINLKRSSEFWWVGGVLFFYFGSTTVNLFHGKLATISVTPKHHLPYYIFMLLNFILYGCWSYAFICKKWLTTSEA